VRIDLFKDGSFLSNITSDSTFKAAFEWAIPPNLTPGSDYTIQITGVTNGAMVSTSAQPFVIVKQPSFSAPILSGNNGRPCAEVCIESANCAWAFTPGYSRHCTGFYRAKRAP
jgi:hypothetical protein